MNATLQPPVKRSKSPQTDKPNASEPSTQPSPTEPLTLHIANRVRALRVIGDLSLDVLAQNSGVSRSMISAIERAETNPTAVVLDRLASALGVTLTELLELPQNECSPLLRKPQQVTWRDSSSGYERRSLSAALPSSRLRLIEVSFPAQARVAYESMGKASPIDQQIWMLAGRMEITVGDEKYRLGPGDCLTMRVDRPTLFFNPESKAARYLVAQA